MYNSLLSEEENTSYGRSKSSESNYKKPLICIGSLVAIVAIVLVLVFVLLQRAGNENETPLLQFTFESVFNSSLSPRSFSLQWGENGQFFIYQNTTISRDWLKFDLATKASSLFVNATELQQLIPNYNSYTISADGAYILFAVNVSSVWRHSFLASYLIYSVADKTVTSLVDGNPLLQNVVWSPSDHKVAYVRDYNIYIYDPVAQTHTAVTTDGDAAGGILNGIQSWVYEEEVFSDFSAIWWSKDGSMLTYLRFNESEVPIFEYTMYTSSAYPTQIPLRYPKAGYTNPQVRLYIFNVTGGALSNFQYLEYAAPGSQWEYIASVQWDPNNILWVQQLNRYQNNSNALAIYRLDSGTWATDVAHTEQSSKWIEISPFVFCQTSSGSYTLLRDNNAGNYHIASFQKGDTWTSTYLTSGNFDVISISGCTPDGRAFYLATEPGVEGATLQHIYSIPLPSPTRFASLASTRINTVDGVFSTTFSPLGDYYVMRYLGPNIPQQFLVSTGGDNYNFTLEDNQRYAQIISEYDLPEKTFLTVEGAAGDTLNAYYKKPKNAKSGHPLLIDVYAGPGTQKVRKVHDVAGLDAWLCSQGYIMAAVDGRGTGGRGLDFMQATYRQLGLLEIADQRAGAKHLSEQISAVNTKRVGIWGWSFGGFMAAHASATTSAIDGFSFKTAVSVAPVTDWTLYDSIYTERFMSTPQDNPDGYNATSVIQHAPTINSNTLLLMHGLADDNVHFQNTAEFVSALIQSNIQFDTMFYPNNNHAINNGNARRYLYEKMINYLNSHL